MSTAMSQSRRQNVDNDFILTISDNDEDISGLDNEDNVTGDLPAQPSRKRKREDAKNRDKSDRISKSKKRKGRAVSPELVDDATETARPTDSDGIDSDFEFNTGGFADDLVEDGFDGWNLDPTLNNHLEAKKQTSVDLDAIIARRRKQRSPSNENVDDGGVEVSALLNGNQEDENEMLEDDVFGVAMAHDDEDETSPSEDSDDPNEVHVNGVAHSESGSEDGEEPAMPVSHPDDVSENESLEEGETPEEMARRAAFFAPAELETSDGMVSKASEAFQSMSLSRPILKGLASIGFTSPTPIQAKAIPVALQGKDVVGGAVTGSGKTAAFMIPILERLLYRPKKVATTRVGILMPTRELAVQCFNVATKLTAFTDITIALTVGGLSLREQEQTLKKRPDIVIATPGRFIDHMRNSASFVVENLEILVLDEADRMLEDGFADELNEILSTIPKSRQTMLFSATMTEDVDKLIRVGLNRPVRLLVDAKKQTVQGLTQEFVKMKTGGDVPEENRRLAYLLHLCQSLYTDKTIVFFPRKILAHRVKVLFAIHGIKASELHGSMSQEQRLNAISSFREGECTHLLATDLASRGLDVPRVETVINFTVPPTTTTYLHRVGRTARAGRSGVSCTLFSPLKEQDPKNKESGKAASERTLLRPILKLAKSQKANIRTRSFPSNVIADLTTTIRESQSEIDAILLEEKEERLLLQSERDVTKGENLVKYEHEIASRPKRTWFQSEKEKNAASKRGVVEHLGESKEVSSALKKKGKKKLSGKDKKRLMAKDTRIEAKGQGWKKGKSERMGKGVLQKKTGQKKAAQKR